MSSHHGIPCLLAITPLKGQQEFLVQAWIVTILAMGAEEMAIDRLLMTLVAAGRFPALPRGAGVFATGVERMLAMRSEATQT